MEIHELSDSTDGWFIGNFPSLLVTKDFEVSCRSFEKGHPDTPHYHKIATEYNLMIRGIMKVSPSVTVSTGQILIVKPYESVAAEFLTDCEIVCIKVPSVSGDKYIIDEELVK